MDKIINRTENKREEKKGNDMSKFIIIDWTGRVMDTKAMAVHYKSNIKVPREFKSFEDAEDFLCEVLNDEYETDRQEYYIEQKHNIREFKFLDPNDIRRGSKQ